MMLTVFNSVDFALLFFFLFDLQKTFGVFLYKMMLSFLIFFFSLHLGLFLNNPVSYLPVLRELFLQ